MAEPKLKMIELYKPSNGTEGCYFMAEFCENCYHDGLDKDSPEGSCPILAASFAYDKDDDKYPNQWRYVDGKPTCISFFNVYPGPNRLPATFRP